MSRVDDSDNQRIREMQEAELRQRVDREKKDTETRISRSFNEVMSQRSKGEIGKQQSQNKKESEQKQADSKSVLDQVRSRDKDKKSASELARKAAMSRSQQAGLLKNRAAEGQEARVAVDQKSDELVNKGIEERDRIEREIDREESKDAMRSDEKQAEHRLVHEHLDQVDPDDHKQQQRQGRDQEEEKAEQVSTAEGPRAAHAPRIPPDLIERIVNKLFQAITPDGRTSLQMDLKGEGLEGVTLKIAAEQGRVTCSFEGCSNELKAALRNGKPALTRGLAKRGLKLVALRVC